MTAQESLLPCPFCGGRTFIDPVGRSWWRLYSWHKQTCPLSEVDHDVPQTEDQKQLLIDAWNSRAPLEAQQERKPLGPYGLQKLIQKLQSELGVWNHGDLVQAVEIHHGIT